MLIQFPFWRCLLRFSLCPLDSSAAQPTATVADPCCSLQTLSACRPHSRGAKSEVQGTNRDAASTLATLHSFKEWNAAQQKTAHSLAGAHPPAESLYNDQQLWPEGNWSAVLLHDQRPLLLSTLELLSYVALLSPSARGCHIFGLCVAQSGVACADVIRSANAAACQPVLPGQPLHKHASAPGSTAMGRQFRGSRDLQPWATEPLLRSRSENAMRAPTPTEETDSLRSREPSPEAVSQPHVLILLQIHGCASSGHRCLRAQLKLSDTQCLPQSCVARRACGQLTACVQEDVPSKSDGQRREDTLGDTGPALVAVDTGASNDLMRQPGGFVIRMAAENGQDPSRSFTAVPASKADVPTIRIITSNPAQQPAGFVAPIAFPGFSRGFSTVS